ncbi:hypothetical protein H105_05859, partial [Trichophyton soudanense CBS 452.61]
MLLEERQFGGEGHVAARRGRREEEGRASDEGEEEEEKADWTKQKGRRAEEEEEEKKKRTNAAKGVKQASQRGGSGRAAAETMQPLKARIRNTDTCTFAHASRKKQRRSRRFFGLSMMLSRCGYDEAWAVGHAHPDRRIEASQRPPRLRAGPGRKGGRPAASRSPSRRPYKQTHPGHGSVEAARCLYFPRMQPERRGKSGTSAAARHHKPHTITGGTHPSWIKTARLLRYSREGKPSRRRGGGADAASES